MSHDSSSSDTNNYNQVDRRLSLTKCLVAVAIVINVTYAIIVFGDTRQQARQAQSTNGTSTDPVKNLFAAVSDFGYDRDGIYVLVARFLWGTIGLVGVIREWRAFMAIYFAIQITLAILMAGLAITVIPLAWGQFFLDVALILVLALHIMSLATIPEPGAEEYLSGDLGSYAKQARKAKNKQQRSYHRKFAFVVSILVLILKLILITIWVLLASFTHGRRQFPPISKRAVWFLFVFDSTEVLYLVQSNVPSLKSATKRRCAFDALWGKFDLEVLFFVFNAIRFFYTISRTSNLSAELSMADTALLGIISFISLLSALLNFIKMDQIDNLLRLMTLPLVAKLRTCRAEKNKKIKGLLETDMKDKKKINPFPGYFIVWMTICVFYLTLLILSGIFIELFNEVFSSVRVAFFTAVNSVIMYKTLTRGIPGFLSPDNVSKVVGFVTCGRFIFVFNAVSIAIAVARGKVLESTIFFYIFLLTMMRFGFLQRIFVSSEDVIERIKTVRSLARRKRVMPILNEQDKRRLRWDDSRGEHHRSVLWLLYGKTVDDVE